MVQSQQTPRKRGGKAKAPNTAQDSPSSPVAVSSPETTPHSTPESSRVKQSSQWSPGSSSSWSKLSSTVQEGWLASPQVGPPSSHENMTENARMVIQGLTGLGKGVRQALALDLRSLALFRMLLGLVTLVGCYISLQDVSVFYSDQHSAVTRAQNWASRTGNSPYPANKHWIALHDLFETSEASLLLIAVQALLALALATGYTRGRTGLVCFLCWFLKVSQNHRNLMILNGMDDLHQVLFWWAIFLPLDKVWAFDAQGRWLSAAHVAKTRLSERLSDAARRGESVECMLSRPPLLEDTASVGSIALACQIAVMYAASSILKSHPRWWRDGTAGWYSLQYDWFSRPAIKQLALSLPEWMLTAGTLYTWNLERYGGLLILCPIAPEWVRPLGALLFALFHALNMAMLRLDIFPLLGITSVVAFVSPAVWTALSSRLSRTPLSGLAAGLDPPAAPLDVQTQQSLAIATPAAPPASADCWRPPSLASLLCSFSLVYILLFNLGTTGSVHGVRYIDKGWLADRLAWGQCWNMFSASPPTDDGWTVYLGTVQHPDGQRELVNLWDFLQKDPKAFWPRQFSSRDGVARWRVANVPTAAQKFDLANSFKNTRWQKFLWRLWDAQDLTHQRPHFAAHLCDKWAMAQSEFGREKFPSLLNFSVWWMNEPTLHKSEVQPGQSAPVLSGPFLAWWFDCQTHKYEDAPAGMFGSTKQIEPLQAAATTNQTTAAAQAGMPAILQTGQNSQPASPGQQQQGQRPPPYIPRGEKFIQQQMPQGTFTYLPRQKLREQQEQQQLVQQEQQQQLLQQQPQQQHQQQQQQKLREEQQQQLLQLLQQQQQLQQQQHQQLQQQQQPQQVLQQQQQQQQQQLQQQQQDPLLSRPPPPQQWQPAPERMAPPAGYPSQQLPQQPQAQPFQPQQTQQKPPQKPMVVFFDTPPSGQMPPHAMTLEEYQQWFEHRQRTGNVREVSPELLAARREAEERARLVSSASQRNIRAELVASLMEQLQRIQQRKQAQAKVPVPYIWDEDTGAMSEEEYLDWLAKNTADAGELAAAKMEKAGLPRRGPSSSEDVAEECSDAAAGSDEGKEHDAADHNAAESSTDLCDQAAGHDHDTCSSNS